MSRQITDPDGIRGLIEQKRDEARHEFMVLVLRDLGCSFEYATWLWEAAWTHGRTFGVLAFYAEAIESSASEALEWFLLLREAERIVAGAFASPESNRRND